MKKEEIILSFSYDELINVMTIIPSSVCPATNIIYNVLYLLHFLTENRKLETENGIMGQ
jgi:hypothetical protein